MTAERLLLELASDDVPKISSGRFNWRPVEGAANQPKTNGNQIPVPTPAPSPAAAIPLAFRESLGAPTLTSEAFPLNLLENKTFMGTGMNMIWRPRSSTKPSKPIIGDAVVAGGAQDVLQFNMTAESMAFSGSIGEAIPNRGAGDQGDISLQGIPYVQRVGSFEDPAAFVPNEVASSKAKKPEGIHFETGCFMFVPEHKTNGATLNRMASIPHGTTINAQGFVPSQTLIKGKPQKTPRDPLPLDKSAKGPPQTVQKVAATDRAKVADNGGIPAISIVPFNFAQSETKDPADPKKTIATTVPDITKFAEAPDKPDKPVLKLGDEVNFFDETHLKFDESPNNRLPTQWKDFVRNNVLTEKMFRDPNEVLSKAIEDQDIESFCTFTLTTTASDKVKGGGIANIGFLEGPPASRNNGRGNAQPVSVTVTYWIETVRAKLTLKPGVSSQQAFQMINKAGVLGPLFVAPPTTNEKQPISKTVRWTQLQYSQNVTLNFSGLSWPHISVATLGETGTKELDLTPS